VSPGVAATAVPASSPPPTTPTAGRPTTLAQALGVADGEVVALVGGGGKSTAMFRLAGEIAERGGRAITTTTTHIFAAQIALAPAHVRAAAATRDAVAAALDAHRHVLVVGATNPETARAAGPSLELLSRLRAWFPGACLVNEADGSRMRPFKAPADHEPVIPAETTLVVPVVGADVLGQPLDDDHVHRAELVSALAGVPLGSPVTPEVVARVLAHPRGGRKGVPPGARVVIVVNKADALADRGPAREVAERLLREPAIHAVALTAVRAAAPVLELHTR
jgi:molybdenum cofactor cytidylyltransferase